MGYAIIIEDKVFSVNRVDQVTPAKQELRENLTSVAFTYGQFNPTDNSVSLASVTLTPATATQNTETSFPVTFMILIPFLLRVKTRC